MSLAIGLWCVACMALTVAGSLWPQKLLGAWDACSSALSGDLSLLQCPIPEDTSCSPRLMCWPLLLVSLFKSLCDGLVLIVNLTGSGIS